MAALILLACASLACRTGGAAGRPHASGPSEAATATGTRELCQNACDKYVACGGGKARRVCVDECSFIFAEDESLTSLMAMQCPAYVSYIDGPTP